MIFSVLGFYKYNGAEFLNSAFCAFKNLWFKSLNINFKKVDL